MDKISKLSGPKTSDLTLLYWMFKNLFFRFPRKRWNQWKQNLKIYARVFIVLYSLLLKLLKDSYTGSNSTGISMLNASIL